MISYDYKCSKCGTESIEIVKYTDRDHVECSDCGPGQILTRVFRTVNNLKASYPDGFKRSGFQELKIDAKLRAAAMIAEDNGSVDDYAEISKERTERDKKG